MPVGQSRASSPRPKSPRTPDPDAPGPKEAVFRGAFLTRLAVRRERDTVRPFGDLLAECIRDFEGAEAEVGEGWSFREMRTGIADLRLLEAYLRGFHDQSCGNSRTAGEGDLCDPGREVAEEIARIAERVEDGIGPAPEPRPER